MNDQSFDVAIVGAGPAGTVAALTLSRCGYRVCIVEREPMPRQHIGESLPPSIIPLLKSLDLWHDIESAGFMRSPPPIIKWAGANRESGEATPRGLQVDRGRFDQLLLRAAVASGARAILPATVSRSHGESGTSWILSVATGSEYFQIRSRFLIDAAGASGYLPSARRTQHNTSTYALYSWWKGVPAVGNETRVEAGDQCWYWAAPLPGGTFNITVFIDQERLRGKSREEIKRLYLQLVQQSTLIGPIASACRVGAVKCCNATCRSAEPVAGANWCKVGEAGFTLDPLSSQGVQTAMATGVRGAAVAHSMLTETADTTLIAKFHTDRQRGTVRNHMVQCRQLYRNQAIATPTEFWRRRSGAAEGMQDVSPAARNNTSITPEQAIRVSPHAQFRRTAVMRGLRIEAATAVISPMAIDPMVFLNHVEIAPLLTELRSPRSARSIVQQWSHTATHSECLSILNRLIALQILEPVPAYDRA